MILTIAVPYIYVDIKNSLLKKIGTDITTKFWSEWEIRSIFVVSAILQLVLVIFGNVRRRYAGKRLPYVSMTVWLVYLSADWVASVAVNTLLRSPVSLKHGLIVYWTPFLLWHLGSPLNVTAYSLEDIKIWSRRLASMVYLVVATIYICVRFRSDSTTLNYMAAPIFITGIFKYGERIWALRSASEEQLINSLYPFDRTAYGHKIRIGLSESAINSIFEGKGNVSELNLLREAYSSFIIFKPFFYGFPLGLSAKYYDDMVYIKSKSAEQAFELVGTELGYLYDLLFTKIPILHNHGKVSTFLRVFCFLSVMSSLIAFSTIVDKSVHSKVDIVVTYLLLLGAICLDIYSFIMQAISTWAMVWLPIPDNKVHKFYSKVVARRFRLVEAKMGIKSMGQYDLINYIVNAKTSKFIDAFTGNHLRRFRHTHWKSVDSELKQFIYSHLVEKHRKWKEKDFSPAVLDKLLNATDENVLQEASDLPFDDLQLLTGEFTERIFIWHLATELVYYDDVDSFRRGTLGSCCQIAKSLCEYMMYLVLLRPLMMPLGLTFNDLIIKRIYMEAARFFPEGREQDRRQDRKRFTTAVIQYKSNLLVDSNSIEVMKGGSRLAQTLQSYVTENYWDHEKKWEMISKVWMEMMVHAASHCSWNEHAQQLRHGGELLTHVALLMAHLGLTTKIHRGREPDEDEPPLPY